MAKAPAGWKAQFKSDIKSLKIEGAARKYGVSTSWLRRIVKVDARKKLSKRRLNFLNKAIEHGKKKTPPPPPPPPPPCDPIIEIDSGVQIVKVAFAEFILKYHPEARRGKIFFAQKDAVDHANTIVGASAVLFAWDTKKRPPEGYPWRYGVLDDASGEEFEKMIDLFCGLL